LLRPGQIVAERFRVEQFSASGGMGVVFRAVDTIDGAAVALKVLVENAAASRRRFDREVRLTAAIRHPGLPPVRAEGLTDDGVRFVAMDWIDGPTLASVLDARCLTEEEALALVERLAGVLAALHARGVVHRDVKPRNVVLRGGRTDDAVLLDLGIALSDDDPERLTAPDAILGTPGYMAPEQVRGGRLGPPTDVYALGALLHRALRGRVPFDGQRTLALLASVLFDPAPRLEGVSPGLAALAAAMLAKEPSARPADGGVLLDAVRRLRSGQPLSLALPVVTETELRWVSVVLVGRTEQPTRLLVGVVAQHDGVANLFVDGSMLGVFSSGTAADRANAAAACALSLARQVPDATLIVASGTASSRERSPSAVRERASELASRVGAGTWVDPATARLLDERYTIVGERLVAGPAGATSVRHVVEGATPFVGRAEILRALGAAWASACVGRGAAWWVQGEPGMGKSRLRAELVRSLATEHDTPRIAFARGRASQATSPLAVVGGLLRSLAGLEADVSEARVAEVLGARVPTSLEGDARLHAIELLQEAMGVPVAAPRSAALRVGLRDPRLRSELLRRAVVDLFARSAHEAPLLVLVDDAHAADAASIEVLDEMAEHPGARLLVVAFARTGATGAATRWDARTIDPLDTDAALTLLRHLVGDVDDAVALAQSAGGNPFLLEEIARAWLDGRAPVVGASLAAVVESRVGGLAPAERRLLRAASVIGTPFGADALAMLLGQDAASVLVTLRALEREGLVVRAPHDAAGAYAFRHELLQRGAYALVPADEAAHAHASLAAWLEAHGPTRPAELAYHYERAGDATAAARWAVTGAYASLDAGDPHAAVALAERALALGAAHAVRGRAHVALALAHAWLGKNDDAAEAAAAALSLLDRDEPEWGGAIQQAALAAHRLGDVATLVRRAEELREALAVDPRVAGAGGAVAFYLALSGRTAEARALVEAVERHAAERDPVTEARLLETRASIDDLAPDAVVRMELAARDACARSGSRRLVAAVSVNLASVLVLAGDYAEARRRAEEALEIARPLRLAHTIAAALQNASLAALGLGDASRAFDLALESAELFVQQGDARRHAFSVTYAAMAELDRGEALAASTLAETARAIGGEIPSVRPLVLAVCSLALGACGDREAATGAARDAEAALVALGRTAAHQKEEGASWVALATAEALVGAGELAAAGARIDRRLAEVERVVAAITDARIAALYGSSREVRALRARRASLASA
jgi:tetratricopeptide (TPR) repeat protein